MIVCHRAPGSELWRRLSGNTFTLMSQGVCECRSPDQLEADPCADQEKAVTSDSVGNWIAVTANKNRRTRAGWLPRCIISGEIITGRVRRERLDIFGDRHEEIDWHALR
jgi:hypothetical protein